MKRKTWFVGPMMWLFSLSAHAADALVDGYHLRPATATVKTGGTVKLKLVQCHVVDLNKPSKPKTGTGDKAKKKPVEDDLAPLVWQDPKAATKRKGVEDDLAPLPVLKLVCEGDEGYGDVLAPLVPLDVQWRMVDGQGRVTGNKTNATYHAPSAKPSPNRATVSATYLLGKEKTILLSRITILDKVTIYTGSFTMSDVTVNSEYVTSLTGNIRWEFDEYYEEGGWREYTGSGTAALRASRKGCGAHAEFSKVPVEGRLKVFDDKKYEFLINLVGEAEQTRTCRHGDAKWVETFSSGGHAMNQGDPCGLKEFYPEYSDVTNLSLDRKGGCTSNIRNQYREGWSFQAVE